MAKLAIADGQQKNMDVVLIDTAGRMQNNDKLMRELAKLVQVFCDIAQSLRQEKHVCQLIEGVLFPPPVSFSRACWRINTTWCACFLL